MINLGDVTKIDWSKYPCDLLSFTFPCQNISIANRNGKGFAEGEDSSSSIIWSLRDVFTKMKKPKFIFMENVSAILNKKHKPTLDKLITFLKCEGYYVDYDAFIQVSQKGLAKVGVDLQTIEDTNIRKLTPDEVMKLTGLNDEVREKLKDFKPNEIYKLCGNSIVVPVLEKVFYEYFKKLKEDGKLDDLDQVA